MDRPPWVGLDTYDATRYTVEDNQRGHQMISFDEIFAEDLTTEQRVELLKEIVSDRLDARFKQILDSLDEGEGRSLGRKESVGFIAVSHEGNDVGLGILDLRDGESVILGRDQAAYLVRSIFTVFPELDFVGEQAEGEIFEV